MMRRGGRQQLELLASPSFFLLLLLLGLTRVPVWPASPLTAPPYERSAQAAANCFALAQLQGAGDIYRHGLCSVVRRGEPPLAVTLQHSVASSSPLAAMAWALICDIVLILSLASYCQIKGESGSVWLVAVLLPVLSVTIPDSRSAVSHVDRLLQVSLGVAVAAAARDWTALAGVWTAVAAYLAPQYTTLLPALALSIRSWTVFLSGCATLAALGWISTQMTGSASWSSEELNAWWNLTELQPNVGMWWYFYQLTLPEWRLPALVLSHLTGPALAIAVAWRFRSDKNHGPLAAALVLGCIVVFAPNPTMAEYLLVLVLLYAHKQLQQTRRYDILVFAGLAVSVVMIPLLWRTWTEAGTTNPNFFFAITQFTTAIMMVAVSETLWAALRQ